MILPQAATTLKERAERQLFGLKRNRVDGAERQRLAPLDAFDHEEPAMMHDGVGGMMWGMGLGWLLAVVVLVLVVAALIKYLGS